VLKTKAERIFDAVVGLLLAAVCTVLLFLYLSWRLLVDADMVVFLFLACGVGAGVGLFFVYRLVPLRVQNALSINAGGVGLQPAALDEIQAKAVERSPDGIKADRRVHSAAEIRPVMKSHGSESVATNTTHGSGGVAVLVTVIAMTLILDRRFDDGWQFLSLALLAGGAMALGLYWLRSRGQNWRIAGYMRELSGGTLGVAAIIGVGMVMARFRFMRYFLGLAVAGGVTIAMFRVLGPDPRENSIKPFE
jgi:hypothetical protein